MQKVRRPLPVVAYAVLLATASWCAADDHPAEPLSVGVTTNENPLAGFEQNLPPVDEQGESLSNVGSALTTGNDDDTDIVSLSGALPPAYPFGYNRMRSATTWIPGDDDNLGWFSYESYGSTKINDMPSLITGFGIHLLDGPVQTDMPPRLFDFSIGVADRRLIQPNIGYDIVALVGAFSDFEGSARDGVRFPSHAVTFLRLNPSQELVLGVDYLDRDDIRLLPVAGVNWTPTDWLRVEAVFPRPRVATRIYKSSTWVYLGGELGGGTWAIERFNSVDDNATYRDLRLVFGWETLVLDSLSSAFEIGYVFDRRLSYSSGIGDYDPSDGFMIRMSAQY